MNPQPWKNLTRFSTIEGSIYNGSRIVPKVSAITFIAHFSLHCNQHPVDWTDFLGSWGMKWELRTCPQTYKNLQVSSNDQLSLRSPGFTQTTRFLSKPPGFIKTASFYQNPQLSLILPGFTQTASFHPTARFLSKPPGFTKTPSFH